MGLIARKLHERGQGLLAQARFNDTHDNVPVMLPGFSMFDKHHGIAASLFTVPRARVDRDEVLATYEAYVDRRLGVVPVPDRIARPVFKAATSEAFFGRRRSATEWWLPAAQLIAIASSLSGVQAVVTERAVHLDMGDYVMAVEPTGCWSNSTNTFRLASDRPDDADSELLRVPLLMTAHPLAKVLMGLGAPLGLLWAANAALRCEAAGRIPKIRAPHLESLSPRKIFRVRKYPVVDFAAAVTTCRLIIDDPYPGSHRDLLRVAVPALMLAVDFNDLCGFAGSDPEKMLTEEACEKFDEYLDYAEKEQAFNP